jgi:hypothetical protein
MKTSITNFLVHRLGLTINTPQSHKQVVSVNSENSPLLDEFFVYCADFQIYNFTHRSIVIIALINSIKINLYLFRTPGKIRGAPI